MVYDKDLTLSDNSFFCKKNAYSLMRSINVYLLLVLSASLLGPANAQTIQKPTIPEKGVGYNIEVKNDTLAFKRSGDWDFSSLTGLVQWTPTEIAPIDSNPSSADYPNATHVKYEDDGEFMLGYRDDGFTFHGEKTVLSSIYEEPLTVMPYPFGVGDKHEERKNENPFTVVNGPPYLIRDDRAITEGIASGKLTMPDKTVFENAILVRARRTWFDRQIGSSACITNLDAYQWWVDGYAIPVVETRIMTQNGPCPPGFQNVLVTKFINGLPLNISSKKRSLLKVYPNPSSEVLNIKLPEGLLESGYQICNANGKILQSGVIQTGTNQINISKLSAGLYCITLTAESHNHVRFVKTTN